MRMVRRVARRRRGFTLLEVLMVIVIIGILAAFIVPSLFNVGEGAKKDLAQAAVNSGLNGSLEYFKINCGRYPTTDEGLIALVRKPDSEDLAEKWRGPYLKEGAKLKDPWDRDYIYVSPGRVNETSYDLSSPGVDGQPGTDDDVANWKKT
jgi:general secretion pathway protein G